MPESVRLTPAALHLAWPERELVLSAQTLRSACRCADCLAGRSASVGSDVRLSDARPVGHYALQLCFDDGHERGIYPWPYLAGLQADASTTRAQGGHSPV